MVHPKDSRIKVAVRDLSFAYRGKPVLDGVNAEFTEQAISAITGPSGQGKSTLLTAINRLADEIPGAEVDGDIEILLEGRLMQVYRDRYYLPWLRRKVGLVFQQPNPLPASIGKNVALPLKLMGNYSHAEISDRCRQALKDANLWDEVADRLSHSALELSGGQQQRLCIARALAAEPEVLMLDEPTSSLDSASASRIEDLLLDLKKRCTIIIVSHYLEQVGRIADASWRIEHKKLTRLG